MYLVARAGVAAPKRVVAAALACGALLVSAGWWVAIVELWPASSRPYIGGSQNNSVLELIFGYNGFGRLTGNETGSVGGGGGQAGRWGADRAHPHVRRRVRRADLVAAAGRAHPARRRPRVARRGAPAPTACAPRSSSGAAGCSSPALVFSLGKGIIHQYYSVALAPAIGALVGMGAAACSGSGATT